MGLPHIRDDGNGNSVFMEERVYFTKGASWDFQKLILFAIVQEMVLSVIKPCAEVSWKTVSRTEDRTVFFSTTKTRNVLHVLSKNVCSITFLNGCTFLLSHHI